MQNQFCSENILVQLDSGQTEETIVYSVIDDPYRVGIEALTPDMDEGQRLRFRIFRYGHTDEEVTVKIRISENGNAVVDTILGDYTQTIPVGLSEITVGYISQGNDGSDTDATFTIEILPDDGYAIDPSFASAQAIVRDTDPTPVLALRNATGRVSEGVSTFDLWVDMVSPLPSLKTITVDYSIHDSNSGNGIDVTESTGTLTFAPGDTAASIAVEVLQNRIAGNDEAFSVVLSNPVNAIFQDSQTSITYRGVIEDDEPHVSVDTQFGTIDEGANAVFELTRTGDTTDELTVWVQVEKTAPQLLSRRDAITFPAGDATVEHVIATVDDYARLGDHTVTVLVLDPLAIGETKTYWVDTPRSASTTVRDVSQVTVSLHTSALRYTEGETIELELRRFSITHALTVTLNIEVTGQYTTGTLPASVTIPSGDETASFEIQTQDDSAVEDVGTITVSTVDGTGYRGGWPNSHTFTIYDNDGSLPAVSVEGNEAWVTEGEPVSFTVSRTGATTDALEVRVKLHRLRYRVTAADFTDPTLGITTPEFLIPFDEEEITVEIPAGSDSVTISRSTTDDNLPYGNSTYHASILNDASDGYVARYDSADTVWVRENDIPTITGTATLSEQYESNDPTVLPFTRTGDTSGALTPHQIRTTTRHQPSPLGDDTGVHTVHVGTSGFDPGEANSIDGVTFGGVESLGYSGTVELKPHYCPNNPSNCRYFPQYHVGSPATVSYRIYSKVMGVRVRADQTAVDEGTDATFTFYRQGGKPDSLTRPLTVKLLVTQTGDFIAGTIPELVTFPANDASVTLSIPTADDAVDEDHGSIALEIRISSEKEDDRFGYGIAEYRGTKWEVWRVNTAVNDNDYVLPAASVSDAQALETDASMEFTISLEAPNSEQEVTVDWATAEDGTTAAATSDVDFTSASGTVTFAIGETEKMVTFNLLDDHLDEDDETFNVVLSNPSEATLGDDTGVGTILDNELEFGVVFWRSTAHTEEGDDITIGFRRLVPLEPDGVVTTEDDCYDHPSSCFHDDVNADPGDTPLTVSLSVTFEGDYFTGTAPTSVTFGPGETLAYLYISTVDDSAVEARGAATVHLLQGSGYAPLITSGLGGTPKAIPNRTHYVYDNDLTIAVDDAQAGEDSGQIDFTVRLNEPAPEEVTVDVTTQDGDATSHANITATSLGKDFDAKSESLTFAAGEQQKTFTVVVADDLIHERDETFDVELGPAPHIVSRFNSEAGYGPLYSLADGSAVGTIEDNEQALVASVSRTYPVIYESWAFRSGSTLISPTRPPWPASATWPSVGRLPTGLPSPVRTSRLPAAGLNSQ